MFYAISSKKAERFLGTLSLVILCSKLLYQMLYTNADLPTSWGRISRPYIDIVILPQNMEMIIKNNVALHPSISKFLFSLLQANIVRPLCFSSGIYYGDSFYGFIIGCFHIYLPCQD